MSSGPFHSCLFCLYRSLSDLLSPIALPVAKAQIQDWLRVSRKMLAQFGGLRGPGGVGRQ